MTLALYMDHHIDSAITAALTDRGVDTRTSQEDGTDAWDDEPLMRRASDLGRVVVSQDRDLLVIAARWIRTGQSFAGLLYIIPGRATVGQAIDDLELVAKVYEPADMLNRVKYIPLT